MSYTGMIFSGFGGQGVLFTGKVVAYAGLLAERNVSWLPSYGPEMRGGTANCSVCISDEPIGSPLVINPDVLVAMNMPSYEKFIKDVNPGGIVIVDSSMVKIDEKPEGVKLFEVPATELSIEHKLDGISNMILLGKLLKETGFATKEIVEKAVGKSVPASKQHLLEHNMRAILLGAEV